MLVRSNIAQLVNPELAACPGTLSARVAAFADAVPSVAAPADLDERLAALVDESAPTGEVEVEPIVFENPCAGYAELTITAASGATVHARYIAPAGTNRAGTTVPLMLMFNDCGRPVRGWHHMTRFGALGYAVLALDAPAVPFEEAAATYPELVSSALTLAQAGMALSDVDATRVYAWGDGLGGALALAVNAVLPGHIAKTVVCNPFPLGASADGPVPAHLDLLALASLLTGNVLVGCGLRDEIASPESQAALVNASGAETSFLIYPEHAHERINEFENEALRFLN